PIIITGAWEHTGVETRLTRRVEEIIQPSAAQGIEGVSTHHTSAPRDGSATLALGASAHLVVVADDPRPAERLAEAWVHAGRPGRFDVLLCGQPAALPVGAACERAADGPALEQLVDDRLDSAIV